MQTKVNIEAKICQLRISKLIFCNRYFTINLFWIAIYNIQAKVMSFMNCIRTFCSEGYSFFSGCCIVETKREKHQYLFINNIKFNCTICQFSVVSSCKYGLAKCCLQWNIIEMYVLLQQKYPRRGIALSIFIASTRQV